MRRSKIWDGMALVTLAMVLILCHCSPVEIDSDPTEEEKMAQDSVKMGSGERLKVVATTNIVRDVVGQVGGDQIELTGLLPAGTDPHSFEPTPKDMTSVADADLIFANGAGLEGFLDRLLNSASASSRVVEVSDGIDYIVTGETESNDDDHEDDHKHENVDPHTWTDPNNVMVWTENIEKALSAADPTNRQVYASNAEAYLQELDSVEMWVRAQVETIPQKERRLVTDHLIFGYFAQAYGFVQVGAVVPGYSTLSEPSARELAELEDSMQELGVRAVFVGTTVNPTLARTVAEDTGVLLVPLYTGSLTASGGEADSYVDYVRYNVGAIVEALKQ